jgi:replicative DNA helicase
MFIDDAPGLTITELRAKARRLKSQHDIQLIVIDYLQLLRSMSRRAQDNRQLETQLSITLESDWRRLWRRSRRVIWPVQAFVR